LQQVRNFEHAFAAAETFANSLAFGVCIGHEISGLDLSGLCVARAFQRRQRAWRLATTSVGGRLRIARNPNQGSSAVGSENTGKQTLTNPLFGALFKRQRLEALADTPALERDRIT
jgi:hypothetical protein